MEEGRSNLAKQIRAERQWEERWRGGGVNVSEFTSCFILTVFSSLCYIPDPPVFHPLNPPSVYYTNIPSVSPVFMDFVLLKGTNGGSVKQDKTQGKG